MATRETPSKSGFFSKFSNSLRKKAVPYKLRLGEETEKAEKNAGSSKKITSNGNVQKAAVGRSTFNIAIENPKSVIQPSKSVPEKLKYQKFEGHCLLNWLMSEFTENSKFQRMLTSSNMNLIIVQFCSHLLAAGVLKQVEDRNIPTYNVFRPDCFYYWTHAEMCLSPNKPKEKLNIISWPPVQDGQLSPLVRQKDEKILFLEKEIWKLEHDLDKHKTENVEMLSRRRSSPALQNDDNPISLTALPAPPPPPPSPLSPTLPAPPIQSTPPALHSPPVPPPLPPLTVSIVSPPPIAPPALPASSIPPSSFPAGRGPSPPFPPAPPLPPSLPPAFRPPPPPPCLPSFGLSSIPPSPRDVLVVPPLSPKSSHPIMKPLYWTKITVPSKSDSKSTFWLQIQETSEDLKEFSKLFAKPENGKKLKVGSVAKKTEIKVAAAKFLDGKRSQNVGILIKQIRLDFQEIENAINNFDTSVISLDILELIYSARGTPEEMKLIENHLKENSDIPLDKPEQFLYEISKIEDRISCMMFQVKFQDSITIITQSLSNMTEVCGYLISSDQLKIIFGIILTLGNYMNNGNRCRGQADAFSLEILTKLKDVKSKENETTLLHYVVRLYLRRVESYGSDFVLPVPEPSQIRRVASVNFDEIKSELNMLQKLLKECKAKTKLVIEQSTANTLEPFRSKMSTVLRETEKQLNAQWNALNECKNLFIKTMKFYLFKPKSGSLEQCAPHTFFELWLPFCEDFKNLLNTEKHRLKKEKIKKK